MNIASQRKILSAAYRDPVIFALCLQVPFGLLCLLMLDGGQLARVCGIAMAATWLGVGLIMSRRPQEPTPIDLAFIRWAFPPVIIFVSIANGLMR